MTEAQKLELTRSRNELGFIYSQRAHGGPAKEEEAQALRKRIQELMCLTSQTEATNG